MATRALKAGQVIFKETAMACAPNALAENVCFGCQFILTKQQPFLCHQCDSPLCNKACQMSAEHQRDCLFPRRIKENRRPTDGATVRLSLLMLPLKCLQLRLEQPDKWAMFASLQSHVDERKGTQAWRIVENNIAPHMITALADQMPDLDAALVHQVCGIIDTNCFEIRIPAAIIRRHTSNGLPSSCNDTLKGAFYEASLMNHSCVPNAQISIGSDRVMVVKSQVAIEVGEPICISYTDPLQTTLYRHNFLHNGKYFICQCLRCRDPTELGTFLSGIRCPACPSGIVLAHSQEQRLRWICTSPACGQEMDNEQAVRMEEVVQNIVKNIQHLPIDRHLMNRCEELFLTLPKKLHYNHALLMQLRIHLMQLYGNVPGFLMPELSAVLLKRKAQLCFEVLEVLRHICPGNSRVRGGWTFE